MSYEQAVTDLRTHLADNWTRTPKSWPNVEFDTTGVDEFVKFNTQHGDATKMEVGPSGFSRYPGVLFLGVNIRTGKGSGRIFTLWGHLADLFERDQIGIVKVTDPRPNINGKSDDGIWYEGNLNFGFRWDARPN